MLAGTLERKGLDTMVEPISLKRLTGPSDMAGAAIYPASKAAAEPAARARDEAAPVPGKQCRLDQLYALCINGLAHQDPLSVPGRCRSIWPSCAPTVLMPECKSWLTSIMHCV